MLVLTITDVSWSFPTGLVRWSPSIMQMEKMHMPWRETWLTWLTRWLHCSQWSPIETHDGATASSTHFTLLVSSGTQWTASDCDCAMFLSLSFSWESPDCACLVRRPCLARVHQGLVTRTGRARETAEARAKSLVKSARRQKVQTLKILLLIRNDVTVLDIFKLIPQFLFFISQLNTLLTVPTVASLAQKPLAHLHHWFFSSLDFHSTDVQNILVDKTNQDDR